MSEAGSSHRPDIERNDSTLPVLTRLKLDNRALVDDHIAGQTRLSEEPVGRAIVRPDEAGIAYGR
jgi:hypothetical protein